MGKENAHVRFRRLHRWIALTATYEELITRIAQEVHKSYKKNQVFDDNLLDLCRSMDELFEHATRYQKELEDEMCTGKVSGFFARIIIRRNVDRYKRLVAEQAQELGLRALNMDSKSFTDSKRVLSLCKRARLCRDAADNVWEQIVKAYREKGGDQNQSAIEGILARMDKASQRLLRNKKMRNWVGLFIGFKEESKDDVLEENERAPYYQEEEIPEPARPKPKIAESSTWLGESTG